MKKTNQNERLGRVGGQAVIEGVMMKAGDRLATACRHSDGSISVHHSSFVSMRKKHKFCNLPLLRGVINFIEMLKLSMTTLTASADAMLEGEELVEGKFEKWCKEKLHINLSDVLMTFSMLLGVLLSVVLFIYLPRLCSTLLLRLFDDVHAIWIALVEGVAKVGIFVAYLALASLLKDMRRVFAYHGAEHKSVACYESGEELTPENAKHHTRFHPRCGTSFMFVMILLGVLVGMFINLIFPGLADAKFGNLIYMAIKLLILPLVVGLGFEFIMYAGKHDNVLVRALSAPGLWMQRITTKEPDEEMLECAITALKCALPDEFPDFDEKTYDRSPKVLPLEEVAEDMAEDAPCDTPAPEDAPCETPASEDLPTDTPNDTL